MTWFVRVEVETGRVHTVAPHLRLNCNQRYVQPLHDQVFLELGGVFMQPHQPSLSCSPWRRQERPRLCADVADLIVVWGCEMR